MVYGCSNSALVDEERYSGIGPVQSFCCLGVGPMDTRRTDGHDVSMYCAGTRGVYCAGTRGVCFAAALQSMQLTVTS